MKAKEWKAYLYLAPAVILAVIFSFLPLAKSFIGSFLRISQSGRVLGWAGLSNYASLLGDPAFLSSVRNTVVFTAIFLPLNTAVTLAIIRFFLVFLFRLMGYRFLSER